MDQDFDLDSVARKSVKGVFALVSRTFIIQVLSVVASFILTIYLDPANYGVFFIVSSVVVFLTYFQDIGLAAALIQKKEEVTMDEYRATFTMQQILVLAVVIPTLFFSQNIASMFNLDEQGLILLLALVVSFFLSSLRTIPTVILERNLDFKRLVIPQIAENLVYNLALIACAVMGFGIATFTVAVILRSVVGLILTYVIQPWPIGLSFGFKKVKTLLSFGIPYQANSLLALVKDDLLIVFVGRILASNPAQVGYIGFAQKWAFLPLRLIMDNVIKITFPSMSRLQHDKDALRLAVEKSLFLVSFFIFPIAVCIILYAPAIISLIPKYQKWEPAILSLSFFALNTVFSSISTPLTNFLTAIGRVKITLYFMIFWTVATWIITPLLIAKYGYNGFAISSFVISTSSIAVFIVARRFITFSLIKPVGRQLLAAIIMFAAIYFTRGMITSFPTLFVNIILGGVVYMGILLLLAREELVKTFKFIIISVRSKN